MVELVDTQDLKSCSRKRSAGSIPALSTLNESNKKPGMKISGFVVIAQGPYGDHAGTKIPYVNFFEHFLKGNYSNCSFFSRLGGVYL
jgi:hypothetical protein